MWNFPCFERRPISVPSLAGMALARSSRLPIRCQQRIFTSVSPKDVHPVFISPLAIRTSDPCTRGGPGALGELVIGSSGTSQVEGFGDVVTEIEVTRPLMPRTTPPLTAAQPASNRKRSVSKAWCQEQEIVVGLDGPPLGLTVPSVGDEGRLDQYALIPSGLSCHGHVQESGASWLSTRSAASRISSRGRSWV